MGQLGFFDLNRRYESPDRTALPPHPPSPAPRDRATRSGVGNRILESQAEKPHEREAVAKLVFRLIVRKIVERLQHQRLEDHHFIPWLASRRILAFRFAPAKLAFNQRRMQLGPERFERNHRGNRYKRIVLFGETFIASVQIEEAKLSHANLPRSEYENLESDLRGGGKRLFFEVPKGHHVHGLTTAACVWVTACIGAACAVAEWQIVVLGAFLVLVILVFGGPFEKAIDRRWPG